MLTKAFRLFVSSTFADFMAERKALQDQVFPALDAYCASKGYQFYPLDMRWGISEEAGLDQRTADICLEEVEAANGYPPPNFLILLGDRYGWVPLPFAVPRDEFEAMLAWLDARGDREAVSALGTVYKLDENRLVRPGLAEPSADPDARTTAYTLLSREDDMPELRAGDAWKVVEDKVRAALQAASTGLNRAGQLDAVALDKYHLSLTEREIRRNLDASSESARGAEAIAFVRVLDGPCDSFRETDTQRIAAVAALRQRVEGTLAIDRLIRDTAHCAAGGKLDTAYLDRFAKAIETKLKEAVDEWIKPVEAETQKADHALNTERQEHAAFRAEKLQVFVGRDSNLAAIARNIASDTQHPLVVHGPSGSGKTALMAQAIKQAEDAGRGHLVYRFVGASAASSDLRALLLSLIDDLAEKGLVGKPAEYDQDANKFSAQIKVLLASISGPAVIFLDALDQLRKPFRLDWLPEKLAEGVRLVLSVLDDPDYEADSEVYRQLLWRRWPQDAFLAIEPLKPEQGRDILLGLEAQAKRRLQHSQRDIVLGHFEAAGASPLYLRTAFEIARGWRSWEADAGRHLLAADTNGLIAQFIADLTNEHHHAAALVARTLGYLSAAKDGLSAKEIIDVLAGDGDVRGAISAKKHGYDDTLALPPSVWVRLLRALKPFLIEKRIDDRPLLHFFHRQVAEVARKGHYEPVKGVLHAALAKYFEERCTNDRSRVTCDKRSLSELPYQLHGVADAPHAARLNEILLSLNWMNQKLAAFASPLPLIEDYRAYAAYDPANRTAAALVGRALALSAGALARDKSQLVSHLLGRLRPDMAPGVDELIASARSAVQPPALVPIATSLSAADGNEISSLQLSSASDCVQAVSHDEIVIGCRNGDVVLWNPRRNLTRLIGKCAGEVKSLIATDDGYVVSILENGRLAYWALHDSYAGEPSSSFGNTFTAIAKFPGGGMICARDNASLCFINLRTSTQASLPINPERKVRCLECVDEFVVAGTENGQVLIWRAETGEQVDMFQMESVSPVLMPGAITALAVSKSGSIAAASHSRIVVWDRTKGTVEDIDGHRYGALCLRFLDDSTLLSGSYDKRVWLWQLDSVTSAALDGHGANVTGVAVLDGESFVSVSDDASARFWDGKYRKSNEAAHDERITAMVTLENGQLAYAVGMGRILVAGPALIGEAVTLKAHRRRVFAMCALSDGRLATGSEGGLDEVIIWDVNSQTPQMIGSHDDAVLSAVEVPDGKLATGCRDGSIFLWKLSTGTREVLKGHSGSVTSLAVLPDGRLVSGSTDCTIQVWDDQGSSRFEWEGRRILSLAVLRDGVVVAGSAGGRLGIFDFKAMRKASYNCDATGIRSIRVAKTGHIIVCYASGAIEVRSRDGASRIARFDGDSGSGITAFTLHQNGEIVAGDALGRLHRFRFEDNGSAEGAPSAGSDSGNAATDKAINDFPRPAPPPSDIATVVPDHQVTPAQLVSARNLETYRGRHLFELGDGRIYLDGLIAVSTLDLARATLDHLASTSTDD